MKKEISLNDSNYFELFIGDRVLKKEIFDSKGKIPIYSANVFNSFGFLEKSNINDFTHDYILWGIDGNFEFNIKSKGEEFATTDHCGTIKILSGEIIPEYVLYQLEIKKHEYGFDRTLRASLTNMKKVVINIPIKSDGTFDRDYQLELMQKYKTLKEAKQELATQIDVLKEAIIEVNEEGDYERVKVSEIFNFPETNSGITKEFCDKNKGNVPVYGCSKSEESVLGHIKDNLHSVKYYQDCLTWNRNGSVGHFFLRQGRFTTNEDHRVIEIKPEYKKLLSELYLKYILQNEVRKLGYGYTNKLGKTKIVGVEINIPIKDGVFDLEKQNQIAYKYNKLHRMKDDIIRHLQSLVDTTIEI